MKHDEPMKGGDEYDAFTRWRRLLVWSRGKLARIKRRYSRRARRKGREQIRKQHDVARTGRTCSREPNPHPKCCAECPNDMHGSFCALDPDHLGTCKQ